MSITVKTNVRSQVAAWIAAGFVLIGKGFDSAGECFVLVGRV